MSEPNNTTILNRYDRTLWFYILSLLIPWVLWLSAGYLSHRSAPTPALLTLEGFLGLAGLIAPVLVAAGYFRDPVLRADLWGRLFRLGGFPRIYLFAALFLIPLSLMIAQLLSLLLGHELDQFVIRGHASFTSALFPTWLILLLAPVIEELAWHSYGTDALRRRFSLFWTSMIFALYWTVWHLPLATIKGYYQSNLVTEGGIYALNFALSLFVFVLLMNWLYYKTGRSVLVAILFHLSANIANEMFDTHPDSKVIQTGILLLVTIVVLLRNRTLFFHR